MRTTKFFKKTDLIRLINYDKLKYCSLVSLNSVVYLLKRQSSLSAAAQYTFAHRKQTVLLTQISLFYLQKISIRIRDFLHRYHPVQQIVRSLIQTIDLNGKTHRHHMIRPKFQIFEEFLLLYWLKGFWILDFPAYYFSILVSFYILIAMSLASFCFFILRIVQCIRPFALSTSVGCLLFRW